MDFRLSEEQQMVRDMVREFADEWLAPRAHEMDMERRIPREHVEKLSELGLIAPIIPEEYDGPGMDYVSYALISEEVGRVDASTATTIGAHCSLCCSPILYFGTEEQKHKFGTPLIKGDYVAGSIGITEPDAGSDVSSLSTTAVRDGDHWIINGKKRHIDNAGCANLLSFWAVTDPEADPPHRGFSSFVVERGTPGFDTLVTKYIGLKGLECGEMHFDNVRLPAENLIGEEGKGFYHIMRLFEYARTGAGGWGVGVAQACLDEAIDYAMNRVQFGQPIINHQAIQMMIADMVMDLELMRMLSYRSAKVGDAGLKADRAVTATKLFCNEALFRIANTALQIHGANGYSEDYAAERHFRDARVLPIGEGTTQMMRLLLTRIELKSRYM